MEEGEHWQEERAPQCGTGAIPKQPCPNPSAYATGTQRQLSAPASSALPPAAQAEEPDPVKEPNKWAEWHAS